MDSTDIIELRVSGLTDVGLARKHNEDCYEIGTEAVSVSPFRGGDPRMMIGDQAVVTVRRTRDLPVSCIATVSGPITDSRASGLRSRTPGQ